MAGNGYLLVVMLVMVASWHVVVDAMAIDNQTYWLQRKALMEEDYSTMIGANLTLSPEEEVVNQLLTEALQKEMNRSLSTLNFPPARNFMITKPDIELSEVFAIIKSMPKGATLHTHDVSMTSMEFVIRNLTYWDNLYMRYEDDQLSFRFADTAPASSPDSSSWLLVSDGRRMIGYLEFDARLFSLLTIVTGEPHEKYENINGVWKKFNSALMAMGGLIGYKPAFVAYLTQAFEEFRMDHVSYMEFRGILALLYELDGTELTALETIAVYQSTVDAFTLAHDDFHGVRFIYAPLRSVSADQVDQYVSLAAELMKQYPSLVAGFDLVGQEDLGAPLKDFIDPLLRTADDDLAIPVYFHAGETNWYGEDADENLFDALLLNARRIGHGYAITRHPALMQKARDANIPLEVCPISNQVLMLVDDLRNHPAVSLAASNFPLVISSDDPAVWGALPLSHDFYEAFLAFGGARADLRFLKQLAINSIEYSSLDTAGREELRALWQRQWDAFIEDTTNKLVRNVITTGDTTA